MKIKLGKNIICLICSKSRMGTTTTTINIGYAVYSPVNNSGQSFYKSRGYLLQLVKYNNRTRFCFVKRTQLLQRLV